mmetsp:Transcript_21815/g.39139  ORF Transcript_21815/g.39139 Transcript_21815/m.39139 type:complete len:314 (-) Transcript_21815:11-952(-)
MLTSSPAFVTPEVLLASSLEGERRHVLPLLSQEVRPASKSTGASKAAAGAAVSSAALIVAAGCQRCRKAKGRIGSTVRAAQLVKDEGVVTIDANGRFRFRASSAMENSFEDQCVDEEAMLAQSTFPIKPDDLVKRCKEVLAAGVGTKDQGADFADDFEFCAPVVGPITKKEYLQALGTFKILDAFPDSNSNYHFFRVDPFEPDRVWFQTRKTGTNTGEFMGKPATGKVLHFPPESYSMKFNSDGKVREFTVGYVMDRRAGNTGGLGGAFGYFYGVGRPLPIPECQPYKKSWQFRFLNFMAKVGKRFQGVKVQK